MIQESEEVETSPDGGSRSGPAPGSVVFVHEATGLGTVTPPTLFERRNTTTTTIVDPACPAKPYIVAGHSGADHPLGYGAAGPSVSFGEDPTAHQLQLGQKGGCLLHRECTCVRSEEKGQAGLAKPLLFTPGGTPRDSETLASASGSHYYGPTAITLTKSPMESGGDSGGSAQDLAVCLQATAGPTGVPKDEDPGDVDPGGSEVESDDEEAPPLETPGNPNLESPEGSRSGGRESTFLKWGTPSKANDSNEFHSDDDREMASPGDQEGFPLTIEERGQQGDSPLHSVSWQDESHPTWVRVRTIVDSGPRRVWLRPRWPPMCKSLSLRDPDVASALFRRALTVCPILA